MNEINIPCSVYTDLFPLSLDRMTSDETEAMLQAHLCSCDSCRDTYHQMGLSLLPKEMSHPGDSSSHENDNRPVGRKMKRRFRFKTCIRILLCGYVFILLLILAVILTDMMFLP